MTYEQVWKLLVRVGYQIEHEVREVIFGQPFSRRWRKKKRLLRRPSPVTLHHRQSIRTHDLCRPTSE